MKKKHLIYFILVLLITHYLHYKLNRIRQPFYNTIFSVPDLPTKFTFINVEDTKQAVQNRVGLPLNIDGNRYYYSQRGNEVILNREYAFFWITFNNDTVSGKNIFFDD